MGSLGGRGRTSRRRGSPTRNADSAFAACHSSRHPLSMTGAATFVVSSLVTGHRWAVERCPLRSHGGSAWDLHLRGRSPCIPNEGVLSHCSQRRFTTSTIPGSAWDLHLRARSPCIPNEALLSQCSQSPRPRKRSSGLSCRRSRRSRPNLVAKPFRFKATNANPGASRSSVRRPTQVPSFVEHCTPNEESTEPREEQGRCRLLPGHKLHHRNRRELRKLQPAGAASFRAVAQPGTRGRAGPGAKPSACRRSRPTPCGVGLFCSRRTLPAVP